MANAFAYELGEVDINGFLSQGYIKSIFKSSFFNTETLRWIEKINRKSSDKSSCILLKGIMYMF